MRILVDAIPVSTGRGGLVTYFTGLLNGWRQADFSDEIYIIGDRQLSLHNGGSASSRPIVLNVRHATALQRIFAQQVMIPAIGRALNADIILCPTPIRSVVSRSIPAVVTVHDLRHLRSPGDFSISERLYRRTMYSRSVGCADRIIAVSEVTKRDIFHQFAKARNKTRVIYHGSDHVDDWHVERHDSRHAIAFAHFKNKRPEVAIRAWRSLVQHNKSFDVELHIVGASREDRHLLMNLSSSLHIDSLVRVHGYLPDHTFHGLLASASLVLMPSSLEGFGLPIVEAMRLRIPVVATDDPAMREVGGDCLLYANPRSVEEFATQCERALFDHVARGQLTDAGYERARCFTWRRAAEETRRVLMEARG